MMGFKLVNPNLFLNPQSSLNPTLHGIANQVNSRNGATNKCQQRDIDILEPLPELAKH